MKNSVIAIVAILGSMGIAPITSAQTSQPEQVRKVCYTAMNSFESRCKNLSEAEAVLQTSRPMPDQVEAAFTVGYGKVINTLITTSGKNEYIACGGFVADEKRRLVITAHHCLPPYLASLTSDAMTFKGTRATYIGSLPEADLALFQLDSLPREMHALPIAQAVVTEGVYARSIQTQMLDDNAQAQKFGISTGFEGPVSAYGTVTSKGIIQVYEDISGHENSKPSFTPRSTRYEMLRMDMMLEPGFSGSPLYNESGEVVGILSSVVGTSSVSYASSSKNFAELLSLYKERRK